MRDTLSNLMLFELMVRWKFLVFGWWEKIGDRYTFKIDIVGTHGEMKVSCFWVVGEDG